MILFYTSSKPNMNLLRYLKCFFALLVVAMQFSCNSTQKDEQALKEIAETFRLSTKNYNWYARENLRELDEKGSDYNLKELAAKWSGPAMTINKLSEQAIRQVDSLKQLLTKKNYRSILQQAATIYNSYAAKVLATNEEMKHVFKSEIEKANNFKEYAPGETLEITAGMGAFTRTGNPVIKINNQNISLENEALALAKIKVPSKPGKYAVPVEVAYTDPKGMPVVKKIMVQYSVVESSYQSGKSQN